MTKKLIIVVVGLFAVGVPLFAQESLTPLQNGQAPQTYAELWANYDPRTEPLDVEVLKRWEEDNVVLKVLRYRIGIFKGQKAMMAGVYGHPKGAKNLPGLVQIHGGGQYADYRAPLTNAKRGYATISISWAGRIHAPGYRVTPAEVKLFWEGNTDDPKYKLTTDWGPLDAYHAPCRNPGNAFAHVSPQPWTLDDIESPRNNPWFLVTVGARRALTFLEQQPEVDPEKLGVYGHSMGGKLTVLTAGADARVKAAAPSCGGVSNRNTNSVLYNATVADDVYLKHIDCPVMFLSPSNDFHGRINDLQTALNEVDTERWRVTCSPHHNHQDTPAFEVASQLWFDQHLKRTFIFPSTPSISVDLKTKGGAPTASITLDDSMPVLGVDIYYTRHGQMDGLEDDRENSMNRFWHHAEATKTGARWTADLPLSNTDQPLWVYANVTYALEDPVAYAGYYYRVGSSKTFTLSSRMFMTSPDQLKAAGAKATVSPSLTIEAFEGDWEKAWFTYRPEDWGRTTHKVYDDTWKAPVGAKLGIDVLSERSNQLVVRIDQYAAEIELDGGATWQSIVLAAQDFRNPAGDSLPGWQGIKELRLSARETLRPGRGSSARPLTLGATWQGQKPKFRNLRWIPEKAAHYPTFSWATVPVGFHFGKTEGLMTSEEAEFVASRASFICLEKAHASGEFKYTEDGIEQEAQQLKKLNPDMKVIFYWNSFLDYPMFRAHDRYQDHPEWWLKTRTGALDRKKGRLKRYDLSNAEVRAWWTDAAQAAVVDGTCDGIFMDAFPQIAAAGNRDLWGIEKYDAIQQGLRELIKETRSKIGDDKLIFYNGIRSTPGRTIGQDYAELTDAAMIEHFGHFQSASKECMLADIQAMAKAGKNGKIVVFKAWPGFAWIDRDAMQLPLAEKRRRAAQNITFPLAAFLAGARAHSYFIYSWGYRMEHGCLEWYPEFDKPLGEPIGDAVKEGWRLDREFEHASVWVNLETREADIKWH